MQVYLKLKIQIINEDIQENQNLLSSDFVRAKQLAIKLTQHLINAYAQMPLDKLTNEIIPFPSDLPYFKE